MGGRRSHEPECNGQWEEGTLKEEEDERSEAEGWGTQGWRQMRKGLKVLEWDGWALKWHGNTQSEIKIESKQKFLQQKSPAKGVDTWVVVDVGGGGGQEVEESIMSCRKTNAPAVERQCAGASQCTIARSWSFPLLVHQNTVVICLNGELIV